MSDKKFYTAYTRGEAKTRTVIIYAGDFGEAHVKAREWFGKGASFVVRESTYEEELHADQSAVLT